MTKTSANSDAAAVYLEGAAEISAFLTRELGTEHWTERRVRHARVIGALPIRQRDGIGLYAFGSELLDALRDPDTLPQQHPLRVLTKRAG